MLGALAVTYFDMPLTFSRTKNVLRKKVLPKAVLYNSSIGGLIIKTKY